MNNKLKIIVCAHKADANIRKNDIYMPIHVGKSLSNEDLGYQGDDTGDNISYKNKNYCELTGLYWAWKNLDCEYVGLAHYRRYFDIKDKNILIYMRKYDIILTPPVKSLKTAREQLLRFCICEDYCIMMLIIKKMYPHYYDTAIKHFNNNKYSRFNMFITSKKILNAYSQWLFPIFTEMEKYVRLSSYSRAARLYGYLSEHLLFIYCVHNNLKILYKPIIDNGRKTKYECIKYAGANIIFQATKFLRSKDYTLSPEYCYMIGLKNDGILDKIINN